ncbi:MAG: hypothetical protein ABSF95_17490 [Verrucomicrobiota bacterium]|jgi:hypothetical protein
MNARLLRQRKAFEFLLEKFTKHEAFTKEQFQSATGWTKASTLRTHWSKQFKTLLVPLERGRYRVSEVFRRFTTWEKFQTHVTQKRRVAADYTTSTFDTVLLFEFFMPLTNEGYLRTALDALFYKDSIMARLESAGVDKVKSHFRPEERESGAAYLDRVCEWISGKFVGYSISHVNGRYRAGKLKSMQQAYGAVSRASGPYLVDETTAIVRFIFPCGKPAENKFYSTGDYFEKLAGDGEAETKDEAARIRWFFYILFVESIVEIVNGEDEIWLLESGLKNKLHIWKVHNR